MSITVFCLKIAPSVLFFLVKHNLNNPSHSMKLIGGGGLNGLTFTTEDSTFGGGLKLFFPTFITCVTFDSNAQFADNLQYRGSPGFAAIRSANSRWNISTAVRKSGRWLSSLNVSGDEICGGDEKKKKMMMMVITMVIMMMMMIRRRRRRRRMIMIIR